MLDIQYIRENLDRVKKDASNKNKEIDFDRLFQLDNDRKTTQIELDDKRARRNQISKTVAISAESEKQDLIDSVGTLKKEIQALEEKLRVIYDEWYALLYSVPNIAAEDVPIGTDEEQNEVVKTWGQKPEFDFEPKDHIKLGTALDILDVEKAAEVSGSRFTYLKGDLVLLQFALINFAMQTLTDRTIIAKIIADLDLNLPDTPFMPMLPPVMVRDSVHQKIHRVFGDQTYRFEADNLNLVASAEHTMAPYHMEEVVDHNQLPLRYIGYSTSFRKEAGTHGKDMGGMFRTHQFDKVEMETFSDAETGQDEQRLMVGIQEYLTQQLEIHYQLLHVCTGDMGGPDYRQYDINCWLPGQGKYRETHTSDYMTDFQTRGINSFYRTESGEKRLLHTNDATAFAMSRMPIAIMENYQQADGTIQIPHVLRPWMFGRVFIGK